MRPWLAFLLFVAGVIVGITFWRARTAPSPAATMAASTEAIAVSEGSRPAPHPPLPLSPRERNEQTMARRKQQHAEVDRLVAAGRNKIVGRYESETVDSAWANATRQELMKPEYVASDQIRAIHAEPSNLAIDCRSSTCRIGADFPDRSTADDWYTLYLTGVGARLPTASLNKSANADGSVHLEIYATARN